MLKVISKTWRAVCGESRTHGSVRAVEGRPSTATLHEASVTRLTREIGENERTVLMGVGWLAREGKLDFEKRKQGIYITLKTQQLDAEVV